MDTFVAESRMVEEHIPYLKVVVKCMMEDFPPQTDFHDLFSHGLIGLLRAVQGYDPSYGTKFTSWAQIKIRGEICTELARASWVKETTRRRVRKYEDVALELERKLKRSPTEEEILAGLGLSDVERKNFLLDVQSTKIISLEVALARDNGESQYMLEVVDESAEDPAAIAAKNDLVEFVLRDIRTLSKEKQEILRLYFFEDLGQEEIAELFKVSPAQIGLILRGTVRLLRRRLLKPDI